jgi:hypothetical protein
MSSRVFWITVTQSVGFANQMCPTKTSCVRIVVDSNVKFNGDNYSDTGMGRETPELPAELRTLYAYAKKRLNPPV